MKWKKLWSLICALGLPWAILTFIAGTAIKYWYMIDHPRSRQHLRTLEDFRLILSFSIVATILVFIKNAQHFGSGKQIGLVTWLHKFKDIPPEISPERRKAQHPTIPEEFLSPIPDQLPVGKQGKMYVQLDLDRFYSYLFYGVPGSGKTTLICNMLIFWLHKRIKTKSSSKEGKPEDDTDRLTFFVFDFKEAEIYYKTCFPNQKDARLVSLEDRNQWGWDFYYRLNDKSTDDDVIREWSLIADVLIDSSNEKNLFFTSSAKNIMIYVGLFDFRYHHYSFLESIDHITSGSAADMLQEVYDLTETRPDLKKVRDVIGEYVGKDQNEAIENVFANIKVNTRVFKVESIRWSIHYNPRKCSPLDLEKGISLFFYPGDTTVTDPVMKIIAKQLEYHIIHRDFMRLKEPQKELRHLVVIADECFTIDSSTSGKPIIDWTLLCSKARGFRTNIIMIWQSYSQLKQLHGDDYAESLMDDLGGVVVLATNSVVNAKVYAEYFGKLFDEKRSYTVGGTSDGTYNRSYEEKDILTTQDVLQLRKHGECLVYASYAGMAFLADAEAARYYNNKKFKEISEKCLEAHRSVAMEKKGR